MGNNLLLGTLENYWRIAVSRARLLVVCHTTGHKRGGVLRELFEIHNSVVAAC